jgi:hypothetical protein
MAGREPESLFSSIDNFLRSCQVVPKDGAGQDYWQEHPCISAAEIEMVKGLGCRALGVEELAHMLRRDGACTQRFLEALVAIGILERAGDRYAATPAARLYFWAVAEGGLPTAE